MVGCRYHRGSGHAIRAEDRRLILELVMHRYCPKLPSRRAKARRERPERGEDVPGLGKPLTREDADRILREAGVDPQFCSDVAELSKRGL